MKRRFAAMLSAAVMLCIMLITVMPVSAERAIEEYIENVGLYDPDGVFTEEQYDKLNTLIQEASEHINMYAAVLVYDQTGKDWSDDTVEANAKSNYIKLFEANTESDTDGVLLVLNMQTNYMYLATSGRAMMYYNNAPEDNRTEIIEDNMKSYLRSNDNTGAVERFCKDLGYYYKKGIPTGSYGYNQHNGKYYYVENGEVVTGDKLPVGYGVNYPFLTGMAVLFGAAAALIAYLIIRSSYKMKKSLNPSSYVSQKESKFYEKHDVFVRAHTAKTRIDTDSGSGGHGGGGSISSFGGHSFGGGGSHW